jgi:hypothetical protein
MLIMIMDTVLILISILLKKKHSNLVNGLLQPLMNLFMSSISHQVVPFLEKLVRHIVQNSKLNLLFLTMAKKMTTMSQFLRKLQKHLMAPLYQVPLIYPKEGKLS